MINFSISSILISILIHFIWAAMFTFCQFSFIKSIGAVPNKLVPSPNYRIIMMRLTSSAINIHSQYASFPKIEYAPSTDACFVLLIETKNLVVRNPAIKVAAL